MTSPRHQSCSLHRWWFEAFLEYLEVPCLFPRSKQAVKVLEQLISKQVSTWKIFDTRISHKFSNAKVPKKSSYFQVFARYPLNPWKRYSFLCFDRLSTDQSLFFGFWSKPPCTSGRLQHQRLDRLKLQQRERWRVEKLEPLEPMWRTHPWYWLSTSQIQTIDPQKKLLCSLYQEKHHGKMEHHWWIHLQ